jgi:hypothetical protein
MHGELVSPFLSIIMPTSSASPPRKVPYLIHFIGYKYTQFAVLNALESFFGMPNFMGENWDMKCAKR